MTQDPLFPTKPSSGSHPFPHFSDQSQRNKVLVATARALLAKGVVLETAARLFVQTRPFVATLVRTDLVPRDFAYFFLKRFPINSSTTYSIRQIGSS